MMYRFHFFTPVSPAHSGQSYRSTRRLSLVLAAFLCLGGFFCVTSPAHSSQTQGCAPDVPPPVAGNPVTAQASPGVVWINEVLSQPRTNWNCSEPPGVFSQSKDSWIEIYNPQTQPLNLYAAHAQLSLDGGSSSSFLPFGAAIAPGGFLVIFPEEQMAVAPAAAWNVVLSISGVVIDHVVTPPLQPDQSYARVPDGSTTWLYAGHPTIDASNNAIDQPITPTATKTPRPTHTPEPTKMPKGSGAGGASTPSSSGTQPAWNKVQVPAGTAPIANGTTTVDSSTAQPNQSRNASSTPGNGLSGGTLALVIAFSLLLLSAVVWCWRLFRTP